MFTSNGLNGYPNTNGILSLIYIEFSEQQYNIQCKAISSISNSFRRMDLLIINSVI